MTSKSEILRRAAEYVCPGRVAMLDAVGIDLVIGRREGYRIWDVDGRELIDCHLNGGVFNLGHRNADVLEALRAAMASLDIGNHHFPSIERAALGEMLARLTPEPLRYSVFSSGGGEAIDAALKSARHATQRRKIVSLDKAYHGHTGLALGVGDVRYSRMFLSGDSEDFVHVPFNDLAAMEGALSAGDVAAVILETIPATFGFPMPGDGYLPGVRALCDRYGALYIADEVQTGLGRTGSLWGVDHFGVTPDILVTGKGLSGGVYPIAATVLSPRAGAWLTEDGWGHVSTFGGAELGCRVAMTVLEITTQPDTVKNAQDVARRIGDGLREIQSRYRDWFVEIRQCGLVMGLKFAHSEGALSMAKALYDSGLWAMFAAYDHSVLQFKPGLLLDASTCDEILDRFEAGLRRCLQGVA